MSGQEDARKLKKLLKKINTELKTLYDQTSGDRRLQILYERLCKEINDEAKLESELISTRQQTQIFLQEQEKFKQDLAHEKSINSKLLSYRADLQNKHKQIVDDANRSADEERERRMKLSTDFQTDLVTNQKKLEEVSYHRAEYMKYNEMLKEKLKELLGYVEERDTTFNAMLEEKNKELEEYKAKAEEKPNDKEVELRDELEKYKKKFEDFQQSLTESNEHFSDFKKSMEAKAKTLKNLQKENALLIKKEAEFKETLAALSSEVQGLTGSKAKLEADILKLNDLQQKLSA